MPPILDFLTLPLIGPLISYIAFSCLIVLLCLAPSNVITSHNTSSPPFRTRNIPAAIPEGGLDVLLCSRFELFLFGAFLWWSALCTILPSYLVKPLFNTRPSPSNRKNLNERNETTNAAGRVRSMRLPTRDRKPILYDNLFPVAPGHKHKTLP